MPGSHYSSLLKRSELVSEWVTSIAVSYNMEPENCYDITRQLASFTAIKSTKRYGVSQFVREWVWQPLPAEERLHNHFLTQKTVTTSPGSWHHSQPSSLLNVTEWVSESVSQWVSYWQALPMIGLGSDKKSVDRRSKKKYWGRWLLIQERFMLNVRIWLVVAT